MLFRTEAQAPMAIPRPDAGEACAHEWPARWTPAALTVAWMALVALAVAGRLHQPSWGGEPMWNFTPLGAVALAAGAIFRRRIVAGSVPLAALAISNLALPGYDIPGVAVVVFLATAWPALLGGFVRSGRWTAILGGALANSLVFFVSTNLAYWWLAGDHPLTAAGLGACFVEALPFYRWMPVGDVVWSVGIFGILKTLAVATPAAVALTGRPTD
jgi:hypothetical protein